jgi:hypothetical protein
MTLGKMTQTINSLKNQLSLLSTQERADLAYFLIHSLDEEVDTDNDVESAWDLELTRRMEEINRGIASGESSSDVFSQLREKYS